MRLRRPRTPSPAMVVALIALGVALSGSAYAVSNSISGNELKDRSVAGVKLERHTITAVELDKSKLGQVPSAAVAATAHALGGIPPAGFIHGSGTLRLARLSLDQAPTSDYELLSMPGLVDVHAGCLTTNSVNAEPQFTYTNLSGATIDVVRTVIVNNGTTTDQFTMQPGAVLTENNGGGFFSEVMRFGYGTGAGAKVATISTWFNDVGGTCRMDAEADYNRPQH